ncbi:hypothetical protein HWV62_19161 [Athelia sp. TMB]|nr:hypothetical protein HWV62_19161 [Athelia sp. TMB]
MSRKRQRPQSPPIRIQLSRPNAGPSTERTQVNTHIHFGVDTSNDARPRHSVRTSHVVRPVVDLSRILATEVEEDGDMVDAELDSFPTEDVPDSAFGVDEDVVENPDEEGENAQGNEPVCDCASEVLFIPLSIDSPQPIRLSQEWLPLRQIYLDEFLRLEVDKHKLLPLHRILEWSGSHFAKSSLYALGLRVYLGHNGEPCTKAYDIIDGFTVVDSTGIHTVKLVFCGCAGHPPSNIQLLRARWFPATIRSPRSAFTFEVLNLFHLLNIQSKLSLYHFYYAIHSKSDNVGIRGIKDRYDEMRPVMRIWRHLKMLKRAGRGHDPGGAAKTRMGECATECPACPHPGKNLPDGWETAPESVIWLYALIITIDANFRLKLKDKGLADDPPLGDGWSHMVKTEPYKAYVAAYGHQIEPPTCDSDFRASDHTTSRTSTAFKASGVGGVMCGRHGLVMKNGLGDLQKGERQANIDFIVFSALFGLLICALTLSYDICCQWSKNLHKRVKQLPRTMQLADPTLLPRAKKVLPKMHLHNHGKSCQLDFNLNFLRYSAQSDLEDPERFWSWENSASMSTREMTDGARYEVVSDHAGGYNWGKIITFGKYTNSRLLKAIKVAVHMRLKSKVAFENFTKNFPPAAVADWTQLVTAWDKDKTKQNPYEEPTPTVTLASVMLELALEETEDTRQGIAQPHETSASRFLQRGLDLEDQQRKLKAQVKSKTTTLLRKTELLEKRNALRHRIDAWSAIQDVYMPQAHQLRAATASSVIPYAEEEVLYLPSQLPSELHASPAMAVLLNKERRLRIGQADDALHEIRRLLRVSSTILEFKRAQHLASQRITTKTRQLVLNFRGKISSAAERYTAAYNALVILDPGGEWSTSFKPLNASTDLHLPRREDDDPEPENRRELSWIWLVPRSEDAQRRVATADEVCDSMRVEWAKSMARRDRWDEQTRLLCEEMRRVIHYFDWKARWWRRRAYRRTNASAAVQQGAAAYAMEQANMFVDMAKSFATTWYPFLVFKDLPVEWLPEYVPTTYVPYRPRHTDPK